MSFDLLSKILALIRDGSVDSELIGGDNDAQKKLCSIDVYQPPLAFQRSSG